MHALTRIKLLHTVIWGIMVASIFYLVYCGIRNVYTPLTWVSVVLSVGEAAVILANKWVCPLTPLAEKYTDNREPNFDIYLPRWFAKYNKHIFTPIMLAGWVLVAWRFLT